MKRNASPINGKFPKSVISSLLVNNGGPGSNGTDAKISHNKGGGNGNKDIEMRTASKEIAVIIDFGAQYGKLIERRILEQNVCCVTMMVSDKVLSDILGGQYKAVILSGSPNSVCDGFTPEFFEKILTSNTPVLGICFGFQLINKIFGGFVAKESIREDGQIEIDVDTVCPLFNGLCEHQKVLLTHGDSVTEKTVAIGFKIIGRSGSYVAAIANEKRKLYGVQFHPEVDLTMAGKEIFHNFLFNIAGFAGNYTMQNREEKCIEEIRSFVGDKRVLVLVSGGVDSLVCAALLHKALGSGRVVAVHIDNGFMRFKESDRVIESLNNLNLNVQRYNGINTFMNALSMVVLPERKRRIIGDTFMKIKDRFMAELEVERDILLAQGTLRTDLIESASSIASSTADVIKTHHNDSPLVRDLRKVGKLIEPLKDFHKDEVRELGLDLGLPKDALQRHPFPGPGLAIRIICADHASLISHDTSFLETQDCLQRIINFSEMAENTHEYDNFHHSLSSNDLKILQERDFDIGATLLPLRTVGVQGDKRSYAYAVALSTNKSPIPWGYLERLARIIPHVLHNVNRVVYVFGNLISHPINDVTLTYLNDHTVSLLRWADRLATNTLLGLDEDGERDPHLEDCSKKVQQMPVVMVPVHFDRDPVDKRPSILRSFALRPIITRDFMTGVAAVPNRDIPEKTIQKMVDQILRQVPLTSRVMLDLTSKPPGTVEWE